MAAPTRPLPESPRGDVRARASHPVGFSPGEASPLWQGVGESPKKGVREVRVSG